MEWQSLLLAARYLGNASRTVSPLGSRSLATHSAGLLLGGRPLAINRRRSRVWLYPAEHGLFGHLQGRAGRDEKVTAPLDFYFIESRTLKHAFDTVLCLKRFIPAEEAVHSPKAMKS